MFVGWCLHYHSFVRLFSRLIWLSLTKLKLFMNFLFCELFFFFDIFIRRNKKSNTFIAFMIQLIDVVVSLLPLNTLRSCIHKMLFNRRMNLWRRQRRSHNGCRFNRLLQCFFFFLILFSTLIDTVNDSPGSHRPTKNVAIDAHTKIMCLFSDDFFFCLVHYSAFALVRPYILHIVMDARTRLHAEFNRQGEVSLIIFK